MNFPILSAIIFIPLVGALFILITTGHAQSFLNETIQYDGETREYQIYVPALYDGTTPVPVIFNFHGVHFN